MRIAYGRGQKRSFHAYLLSGATLIFSEHLPVSSELFS
jgi:hypothetical protein